MMRGMKDARMSVLLIAAAALCCSCGSLRSLKSESGLYDVELKHSGKALVDGAWAWGGGNPYEKVKQGSIYVAPMDIRKVEKEYPDLAPLMVTQMHEYMVQEISKALKETNVNGRNWSIAASPEKANVRVDVALVRFAPQRPGLRVASTIGSPFIKIPGVSTVVGNFTEGDIGIELTIRDAKDGKLLFACKDSNRKKARLISAEAYSKTGHADVNLRHWAEKLANLVRLASGDSLGGKTLMEYVNSRSWGSVIRQRITD